MIHLKTNRLYLTRMKESDGEAFYTLNADPLVIRYTGDPPFESIEHARQFIQDYRGYDEDGFGRFAVRLKSSKDFIGFCGLRRLEDEDEVDLGFRFMRSHWNKGYATEAGLACLELGFSILHLQRIIGRAMPENLASIRVLQKLGMRYWKDEICESHPAKYFKIEKSEFLQNSSS